MRSLHASLVHRECRLHLFPNTFALNTNMSKGQNPFTRLSECTFQTHPLQENPVTQESIIGECLLPSPCRCSSLVVHCDTSKTQDDEDMSFLGVTAVEHKKVLICGETSQVSPHSDWFAECRSNKGTIIVFRSSICTIFDEMSGRRIDFGRSGGVHRLKGNTSARFVGIWSC